MHSLEIWRVVAYAESRDKEGSCLCIVSRYGD
jgi:hypothetical protein